MAKKKRRGQPSGPQPTPKQLLAALGEVDELRLRRRWPQARAVLEELHQRYPNRVDVLGLLIDVCYEMHDMLRHQSACEALLKLRPNDPELTLVLGASYLANLRPMLAIRAFHRFVSRWPDHPEAEQARKTVAELEAEMAGMVSELSADGEEAFELAARHEEAKSLLDQGRFAEARRLELQLLRRCPDYAPALNNLSLIYFIEDDRDQAIATEQRVLAIDPDNYHALANLIHYLCVSGRVDEARQYTQRLKAAEAPAAADIWLKKAEAFSYLGEDQAVLDAFSGAERARHLEPPLVDPLLYHLAAVAAMRLGYDDQARHYWQQALRLAPGLELAQANLADLRQPVGQRHAPWPFSFPNWITQQTLLGLARQVESAARRGEEAAVQAARRYLDQHPDVAGLIPILLDRGDPHGREFAVRTAAMARSPETLAALRDFALGQRGPDGMRHEAANIAAQAGLLPPGPVRMWREGEWREVHLISYELHDQPVVKHPPQVEEWLREATLALRQRDADRAESLLQAALAVEPEAPDVLNNLATAYELQGRAQEGHAIPRQIHARHPDYPFARIGLARLALARGDVKEAEELLKPLLSRKRFHFSEFAALSSAQIELLLAQNDRDSARSWLDLWENIDPDNPDLEHWRQRLRAPRRLARLFGQH